MAVGLPVRVTKDELEELYVAQRLSLQQIADKFGLTSGTVYRYCKRHGIAVRSVSDACRTNLSGKVIGNWRVTSECEVVAIKDGGKKLLRWKCLCLLCNTKHWVLPQHLKHGLTTKCIDCTLKLRWKGVGKLSGSHWRQIASAAKRREIEFNISIEYGWQLFESQHGRCAITGRPITFGKRGEVTASLDRIDSNKGYVEGNVQWVCQTINQMKWTFSQREFVEMCVAVVEHQRLIGNIAATNAA